ncbi:SAM-dependent methyltransferase [Streptacidiphilus sp. PB12-B1b]|uniref:SAM-dependent methyltransferase n=1 Tax=Streptacidiphilus sp. PB12-B1b TaxID=2705012 RepID=UPI0015F9E2A0|nr:SAM-dependent methyltransferase [Streptacidiphilus sp. PB12-B1b]QMU78649.1 SAM-dependent methyltransferase [Streptacidiphilus sp. PB12-B1b]
MTTVEPSGVWATAVGVARVRARESSRPDALFHDPLAAAFAEAAGPPPPLDAVWDDPERRRRWAGVALSIVVRTRFLDDLLAGAAAAGCRQVVLLGAGMDSRAFRLDWPPRTRLFEVDTAEPLAFKQAVLDARGARPRCERLPVAVDLREDWPTALAAAGHDPALPTAWIAEGLLIYLPQEAVERLLGQVGALSAASSRMGLTLGAQGTLERFSGDTGTAADMWLSTMPEDPVGWLSGLGWEAQTFTVRERAAAYGRPVGGPVRAQGPGGLVSAVRR